MQPTLPPDFHEHVFQRINDLIGNGREEQNPGNNFLPVVPEMGLVFEDPVIAGALLSLLGPGYMMHPHRFVHDNPPGSGGQSWHHDTYWGYLRKVRSHRPWWVMVMYMPQETPIELGPTGVLPGSQHLHKRVSNPQEFEVPHAGPAGQCMIIHYDIWHHKMENFTKHSRYMAKFEFVRCRKPRTMHGGVSKSIWHGSDIKVPYGLDPVWRENWRWITNGSSEFETPKAGEINHLCTQLQSTQASERLLAAQKLGCFGSKAKPAADALGVALHDEHEPVAINSSYALGAIGELGISILYGAMKHGDGPNESDPRLFFDEGQEWNLGYLARNAAHGLVVAGAFATPVLLELSKNGDGLARRYSAFALGEIGIKTDEIEKSLVHLSQDSDVFVRISATESLGLNASGKLSVDTLCQILTDDLDDETRSHAALALWRMSPNTDSAISSLAAALNDGDRYVQGYALEALERIGTPEAMNVLLSSLKTSRWCSITHPQSMF
ncbi:MAG: HEAT repeat domain-containing protein [Chloroflexota bacterium]|nr:HEAT repeat domain-containing protein [Chloroflexota bacterium]